MTRLFLLEDDEPLAEALAWALEKNDFEVTRTATSEAGRQLLAQMGLARLRWPAWGWAALGAGLAVGTLVSWGLCALLRALAPGYFYDMPMFALSPIALVFGALVGVVTVLLAARTPARRAGAVSPLTAVRGNAGGTPPVRRGLRRTGRRLAWQLGVHHALAGRRNLVLVAGSALLAARAPARRLRGLSVTATIASE